MHKGHMLMAIVSLVLHYQARVNYFDPQCKSKLLLIVFNFIKQVTKEELAKLVQGFDKTDLLTSGGLTLAGQRHIYLSGTDRVVRAKLGKTGVHCMKTQQGETTDDNIVCRD
jgi:hypothetical protein